VFYDLLLAWLRCRHHPKNASSSQRQAPTVDIT
jgi:hypothetical protein